MKHIIITLLCLISPLTTLGQDDLQQQKDSLRQLIATREGKEKFPLYKELCFLNYPENEADTLIGFCRDFIREAQRQKDIETEATAREFELAFLFNYNRQEEFFTKAYEHLAFFREKKFLVTYYTTYRHLLEIYFGNGDRDKTLTEAKALYTEAKATAYPYGIASATYIMALVHVSTGHPDDGEKLYHETLDVLADSHELLKFEAYYRLCDLQIGRDDLTDAARLLKQWRTEIDDLAQESNGLVHGTVWHDYYKKQIQLCLAQDNFDRAESYCDSVEAKLQDSRVFSELYDYRSIICENTGRYEEALEWANKAYDYSIEDANIDHSTDMLIVKGRLLCKLGRGEEGSGTYEQVIDLRDSLRSEKFAEQLADLRTQYETDKYIIEKVRNRNYFLFALGCCILLTLVLGGYVYYNRLILRKNRALYLRIKEQERLAEELQEAERQQEETDSATHAADAETARGQVRHRQQRELVARLHDYLLSDRNFANPKLDAAEIALALSTNRTTLFDTLKAVTGQTPVEYIRALQLQESKRMLETDSRLTIAAIAEECGFNSSRTFYRHFREQYNITPTEYRRVAKQESSNR